MQGWLFYALIILILMGKLPAEGVETRLHFKKHVSLLENKSKINRTSLPPETFSQVLF